MDKQVILAVAGSGKTQTILDRLTTSKRSLIITYTHNNLNNLERRIVNRFGHFPAEFSLKRYFPFLYGFCTRALLADKLNITGVLFETPSRYMGNTTSKDIAYYQTKRGYLYYNRIARLLKEQNLMPAIRNRISKYYDTVFIDEVQDFAGHDLNFICDLATTESEMLLVGDFYQHTYDTSKDGNTNRTIYNDESKYRKKLSDSGYNIDDNSLNNSYRCSPQICEFVQEKLGININSHKSSYGHIQIITDQRKADDLFHNANVMKLFLQSHTSFPCTSDNWGASKGRDDCRDVCVVLNPKTEKHLKNGNLQDLSPTTRNKLYVACTRASGNLYFVPAKMYRKYKV